MRQIHKRWSYLQITAATEKEIKSLANRAKGEENQVRQLMRQWAYGIYLGWSNLTMGWQIDGDDGRIKALVDSVEQ